jgi:hypothetical protein
VSDVTISAPVAPNQPRQPHQPHQPHEPLPSANAERRARWQRWQRRGLIALAALIYEVVWALCGFEKLNPTDFDIFFFPAASLVLHGHLFDVYQLRVGLIYPNANGPLGLVPVVAAAWLARTQGWLGDPTLRRVLLLALTAPFPLLAGWEAAKVVQRCAPSVPSGGRLRGLARFLPYLPYLPMLVAPELWLSALYYGHIEQIIAVWLSLAALRLLAERRAFTAGALLGLALLARSDMTLVILTVGLTLLLRRRFRDLARVTAGGALTAIVGIAPFLIVDRDDTVFSLVTFRSALPVGGGNIWSLSDADGFIQFAHTYDTTLALGLAALLTVAALLVKRDLTVESPDFYLLLVVSTLCFPLLIKMLWPYYYQEAALFATVWAMARSAGHLREWRASRITLIGSLSLLWLPRVVILLSALLAEYALEATNYDGWLAPWGTIVGLASIGLMTFVVCVLFAAPILLELLAPNPSAAPRAILTEA